jgi:RNA processing factor Prp31
MKAAERLDRIREQVERASKVDGFLGPCGKLIRNMIGMQHLAASRTSFRVRPTDAYIHVTAYYEILSGGRWVEETSELIEKANEQLQNARGQLEQTVNDIREIHGILFPELTALIEELR